MATLLVRCESWVLFCWVFVAVVVGGSAFGCLLLGFGLVAGFAECLEVGVGVVVGSALVVDVVDFEWCLCCAAVLACVVVAFEYAVSGVGVDVFGGVGPGHVVVGCVVVWGGYENDPRPLCVWWGFSSRWHCITGCDSGARAGRGFR